MRRMDALVSPASPDGTTSARVPRTSGRTTALALAAAAILLGIVFLVDVVLPLGYVGAYLYVIPVFAVGLSRHVWAVIAIACASLALTMIALLFKPAGNVEVTVSATEFNRTGAAILIGLCALVVSAVVTRELRLRHVVDALGAVEDERDADRRVLAAASKVSAIGPWTYTLATDGRLTWSDEAAAIHGEPPGSRPTIKEALSHYDAAEVKRLRAAIATSAETGVPFLEEAHVTAADGAVRTVIVMGETVHEDDGAVRVHGLLQDVTLWRKAESMAAAQRKQFSQFASSLGIVTWTAGADGVVNFLHERALSALAALPEPLHSGGWSGAVHPDDAGRTEAAWAAAVSNGSDFGVECRLQIGAGTYRWHYLSAEPERNSDGDVVTWWGSAVDINSAREESARGDALALEREAILESIVDGAITVSSDWTIRYVNAAAQDLAELPKDALVGQSLWEAIPWLTDSEVATPLRETMEGRSPARLTYHSSTTGHWFDVFITPMSTGLTAFFRDITPVRDLADQLAQAQRLEAVGQLTGGIAHDFNNLLTVVLGGSDAVLEDRELSAGTREMAALIREAALRGAELTSRLLAFARRQILEPRAVDVGENFASVVQLLRRTIGQHIEIITLVETELPAALVDPGQLEHAIINLAVNARDAMPEGGRLVLEAARVTVDVALIGSHAHIDAGDYVTVTVSDNGEGIDSDDLPKVFDPFFTTKPEGEGSGLGLAMVWGFVHQSNGHVTVDSARGVGTTIRMYLPVAEPDAVSKQAAQSKRKKPPRGDAHILLVDDDPLVEHFASAHLRAHGYTVTVASSGPAALAALDRMGRPDLLFTDVIMPGGMTGKDLVLAARERWPGLPVLYTSGYTDDVVFDATHVGDGDSILVKPYPANELLVRVHRAMLEQGDGA